MRPPPTTRPRTLVLVLVVLLAVGGCSVRDALGMSRTTPSAAQSPTAPTVPRTSSQPAASATVTPDPARRPNPTWVVDENSRPGSPGWLVPRAALAKPELLSAYASQTSVVSGGSFDLMIHSDLAAKASVQAYRIGWYGGVGARQVWSLPSIAVGPQPPASVDANRMVSARWNITTSVQTTDWPEGQYVLRVRVGSFATYVPVMVRSETVVDRVVIVSATTTMQAYNTWGGRSSYGDLAGVSENRSRVVSFDRPYDGGGLGFFLELEFEPIQYIESLGLDLGYLTSYELDARPDALVGAAAMVSLVHDEYYSVPMRTAVERALASGTNLAWFGGNAMYWRARFGSSPSGPGRQVELFRYVTEDPIPSDATTTTQWRQDPHKNIESQLLGVAYVCIAQAGAPLVVQDPDFFGFRGTGVIAGSEVPGLVGIEVDRVLAANLSPENVRIVGHSPMTCKAGTKNWSDMTYYVAPSQAGVFAAGSMTFARSLVTPLRTVGSTDATTAFSRAVVRNVLVAFSTSRAGAQNPAAGNVAQVYR